MEMVGIMDGAPAEPQAAEPAKTRVGRVKCHDIPDDLREAVRLYAALKARNDAVPDDVREKNNRYKAWLRHNGQDPDAVQKKPAANAFIPEDLREAFREYSRHRLRGTKPPKDVREKYNEYVRWYNHGGKPPEKRRRLPKPDEVEWPYSAYLEWNLKIKQGVAPGAIPKRLAEGCAEYLGRPVTKYTECSPGKKNGPRCRGMHGNGPGRMPFRPGVALCTTCKTAYTDVPDDVSRCGCCGKTLRKHARHKSPSG